MIGASCADIRLEAKVEITGTTEEFPYYTNRMPSYYSGLIQQVDDKEFEELLGRRSRPASGAGILRSTMPDLPRCTMRRAAIARFAYRKLTQMKKKSEDAGKPDLNIPLYL